MGWVPGSGPGDRFPLELFGDEAIDRTVEGEDGRFRDRLETIGSSDIIRGFGGRRWAMSIVSTMLIFVVQVVVGDIVVGRVRVEDMVYDIEPLSNYNHVNFQTQDSLIFLAHLFEREWETNIQRTWQASYHLPNGNKHQLKSKFIDPRLQRPAISTTPAQHNLFLTQDRAAASSVVVLIVPFFPFLS